MPYEASFPCSFISHVNHGGVEVGAVVLKFVLRILYIVGIRMYPKWAAFLLCTIHIRVMVTLFNTDRYMRLLAMHKLTISLRVISNNWFVLGGD